MRPVGDALAQGAGKPPLPSFDVRKVRADFPGLQQTVNGRPLVYLDNAASAQKPRAVIDAVARHYASDASNVHRGLHELSERATKAYEDARATVQRFIGAADPRECVFVRGTTEGINLVAQTFGRQRLGPGEEILITEMEHHSNIVPWQMLCEEKGAVLRVAPIDDRGEIVLEEMERLIGPRTRLVSVVHISNSLGTVNPVREIVAMAHSRGVPVLVDGAQAVPHVAVDVAGLGCDFYAFSGHKLFGPTGIGVLWGRGDLLDTMPPWQGGGDMISSVTFEKTTYNRTPFKFEAGTPHIAGAIGLAAAIDYVRGVGQEAAAAWEQELLDYTTSVLSSLEGVRLVGTARLRSSVTSFEIEGVHPHDIGTILDSEGIAIRAGHHCTQPVMKRFGVPATARASIAFYNTREEIDALARGIARVREVMGR